MSEPLSPERFAYLAARAGLDAKKIGPERFAELREGSRFVERMQHTVRRPRAGQPRDRAAEPAHIFVHPRA